MLNIEDDFVPPLVYFTDERDSYSPSDRLINEVSRLSSASDWSNHISSSVLDRSPVLSGNFDYQTYPGFGSTLDESADLSSTMPTNDSKIELWERILSGGIGALITSLVVTPFDVVKTRMQVQNISRLGDCTKDPSNCPKCGPTSSSASAVKSQSTTTNLNQTVRAESAWQQSMKHSSLNSSRSSLRHWYLMSNGLMDTRPVAPRLIAEALTPHSPCNARPFRHSIDAAYQIAKVEGVSHLYTGLGVSLWMSIPATVLYFSCYDMLRNSLVGYLEKNEFRNASCIAPFVCGSMARTVSATVISPLELMRTQMMARTLDRSTTMVSGIRLNIEREGFRSLWKGLIPTLWRDIPFSGVYWMGYEQIKDHLLQEWREENDALQTDNPPLSMTLRIGFISGGVSGVIATLLTQPFDVIKTRRQSILIGAVSPPTNTGASSSVSPVIDSSMSSVASNMVRNEGMGSLYAGIGARLARTPLACAVMISAYEVGKAWFGQQF